MTNASREVRRQQVSEGLRKMFDALEAEIRDGTKDSALLLASITHDNLSRILLWRIDQDEKIALALMGREPEE